MKTLLFVCKENHSLSQMAEGLAKHFVGAEYDVFSASAKPADRLHPMAVAVMAEIGIHIHDQKPKNIGAIDSKKIGIVIALCDESDAPELPGTAELRHWPMSDPAYAVNVAREDLIRKFRKVRDDLRKKILTLRASSQTW